MDEAGAKPRGDGALGAGACTVGRPDDAEGGGGVLSFCIGAEEGGGSDDVTDDNEG